MSARVYIGMPFDKVARIVSWDSFGPNLELNQSIRQWLIDSNMLDVTYFHSKIEEVTFGFQSLNDAMRFKLAWGGE